ncbi:MAG: 3'-5' exonuclease, partial [Planctomycetaceae bacterium]
SGRAYSDFAIFYRVNALSRSFETALSRHGVPFQVAAGYSFYERAEIRDLVGYLRLIENPADASALERIINRPARGIGDKTLERLRSFASKHGITVFEAADRCDEVPSLTGRARKALAAFVDLITRLNERSSEKDIAGLIRQLIAEINYLSLWKDDYDEVDQDRAANVHELINAARQYEEQQTADDEVPSLQGFLELASLTSEADSVDESRGSVTLMTMHAAKGLEFPVVYIVGLENGLIPHERAVRDGDPSSFQEERRLLYVGVTRAMQQLFLTSTRERDYRGTRRTTIRSPFASELVLDVVCEDDLSMLPPPVIRNADERLQKARERYRNSRHSAQPGLMSAADLERRLSISADTTLADTASTDNGGFSSGMTVRHPRYGRGIVVDASGGSGRGTVTVEFERDGRRETFVAARCPLQPIGTE